MHCLEDYVHSLLQNMKSGIEDLYSSDILVFPNIFSGRNKCVLIGLLLLLHI